ncbi:urease accessory protein [Poseidonocella pacifica]|uniref:Urease accessory protein UreD n=1 Tax=Poseidonocella pacifica TaxID=871651 RepID=A0A1I0XCN8_9RHOB|nr:urease accessory protein UreD [Poseidonocella pacifica]SFA98457.1 urease accessory protein [Poseidonocella pacifica]
MGIYGAVAQSAEQIAPIQEQPRARGTLRLSTKAGPKGSAIDGLRQQGCLKALFPRVTGHTEAILINTSGGITGGDRLRISATAGAGSRLALTTQAAERAYAAQPGPAGRLTTDLTVADGASLAWLPQETILFDRSALNRRLSVDLAPEARFLMVEPIIFGRRAMGERLSAIDFDDRVEIRRAGRLIYLDAARLNGDAEAHLDRPAIGAGARAMAAVVFAAPEAEAQLPLVRALLPQSAGASLLGPDLLVARLLAPDSLALRRMLLPLLTRLNAGPLPRSWMT